MRKVIRKERHYMKQIVRRCSQRVPESNKKSSVTARIEKKKKKKKKKKATWELQVPELYRKDGGVHGFILPINVKQQENMIMVGFSYLSDT